MPLVSIILPTYNRGKSIQRSINSILDQTYEDFELIIVDDGSTDNTKEIVSIYKDSRIRYFKHEINKGQSIARNTGINNVNQDCKFIAFQDSDDIWVKNKLELQIRAFDESPERVGLIFCSYKKIYLNKLQKIFPTQKIPKNGDMYYKLLESSFIGTPTTVIKKECIKKVGGFDESLTFLEDWEFFVRISKYYHFKFINLPLLYSYESEEGITSSEIKAYFLEPTLVIFKKHNDAIISKKKILEKYLFVIGKSYFFKKEFKKSKVFLKHLVKTNPYKFKHLFYFFISGIFFKKYAFNIYNRLFTQYEKLFRYIFKR